MAEQRMQSRFLEMGALSQLAHLRFATKHVVEGAYSGRHRSRHLGGSSEFREHRQYSPGDDVRRLDWKVLGRTGRSYVRIFEDETNLVATLVLDVSRSMLFGARSARDTTGSKLDYGRYLCAALGHIITKEQDRFGLALASASLDAYLPARAGSTQLDAVLAAIEDVRPVPDTNLAVPLRDLFARLRGRGVLIIVSDFLEEDLEALFAVGAPLPAPALPRRAAAPGAPAGGAPAGRAGLPVRGAGRGGIPGLFAGRDSRTLRAPIPPLHGGPAGAGCGLRLQLPPVLHGGAVRAEPEDAARRAARIAEGTRGDHALPAPVSDRHRGRAAGAAGGRAPADAAEAGALPVLGAALSGERAEAEALLRAAAGRDPAGAAGAAAGGGGARLRAAAAAGAGARRAGGSGAPGGDSGLLPQHGRAARRHPRLRPRPGHGPALRGATPGDVRTNLILAGAQPQAAFDTFSSNYPALEAEVRRAEVRQEELDAKGALARAAQLISAPTEAKSGTAQVVIVTDLQETNWSDLAGAQLPAGVDVRIEYVGLGPDAGNLAVTDVSPVGAPGAGRRSRCARRSATSPTPNRRARWS